MDPLAEIFRAADATVLTAAGIFARVGAVAFLLPGIGERGIPVRLRLGVSLALTVLLLPLVRPLVQATPGTVSGVAEMLAAEAVAGLVIGLAFRLLVLVLQMAGTIAAYHLSITHVFGTGVAQEPEPTLATLLGMGGAVIALQAGLHVAVVATFASLYEPMPFGTFPLAGDTGAWTTARVAEAFSAGLALAFPFIAISFAYNLALGALSRAMPQLMVALVGVPLLIGLGLLTLHAVLPAIYLRWRDHLEAVFSAPLGGLG